MIIERFRLEGMLLPRFTVHNIRSASPNAGRHVGRAISRQSDEVAGSGEPVRSKTRFGLLLRTTMLNRRRYVRLMNHKSRSLVLNICEFVETVHTTEISRFLSGFELISSFE